MCDECKSLSEQSISMFFSNSELAPDFYLELTNVYYCNNCGRFTVQYDIDTNIAKAVRLLNIHGFKTKFSCEGHYKNIRGKEFLSTPYIRFNDFGGIEFKDFIKDSFCDSEISNKEKSLVNIGWKFYYPLNNNSTDLFDPNIYYPNSYDLRYIFADDETRGLNEVFKEACENLYKVLLEILIDHEV